MKNSGHDPESSNLQEKNYSVMGIGEAAWFLNILGGVFRVSLSHPCRLRLPLCREVHTDRFLLYNAVKKNACCTNHGRGKGWGWK